MISAQFVNQIPHAPATMLVVLSMMQSNLLRRFPEASPKRLNWEVFPVTVGRPE